MQKCLPMENLHVVVRELYDSARGGGGNRKEVLANNNKTEINIGHQHDRWMELKEALIVQDHAEVPLPM